MRAVARERVKCGRRPVNFKMTRRRQQAHDPDARPRIPYRELPQPTWASRFRPAQLNAISAILTAFDEGIRIVCLDAPTGAGKSLIAEQVRRALQVRACYMATTKELQAQLLDPARGFTYGVEIKGASNYPTEYYKDIFCSACTGRACEFCPSLADCPYRVQKQMALAAQLAIANHSYVLAEANSAGSFGVTTTLDGRVSYAFDLMIVDEADMLEASLMSFIQLEFTTITLRSYRVSGSLPPEDAKPAEIETYCHGTLIPAMEAEQARLRHQLDGATTASRRATLAEALITIGRQRDRLGHVLPGLTRGTWVMLRVGAGMTFKPVRIAPYVESFVLRHAPRWLLMSGTFLAGFAEDLNLNTDETRFIRMPSTYPAARRPVYALGTGRLNFKTIDAELPKVLLTIQDLLEVYPDERILVHCHSWKILKQCQTFFTNEPRALWYTEAAGREALLVKLRTTPGAVCFTIAMDRGIDLPDDACRLVIIVKIPFAGQDKQVKARQALPGGWDWYNRAAIRALIQMSGRAVRSQTDWAVTYILDQAFAWLVETYRREFPRWWLDALTDRPDSQALPVFRLASPKLVTLDGRLNRELRQLTMSKRSKKANR